MDHDQPDHPDQPNPTEPPTPSELADASGRGERPEPAEASSTLGVAAAGDRADERGRRVPRSAVAFLAVAVLLVAGLFVWGDELRSPVGDALDLSSVPAELAYERTLVDLGTVDGVWLSGFPSYASFTVPLPTDSPVVGPSELVLHLDQDVSPDEVVVLRTTVDGRRLREQTLDAGRSHLELRLPVDAAATSRGSVRVGLELSGDRPSQLCRDDRAFGAVVHVQASSGLRAELAEPLHTVRDVVATAPHRATLVLPDADDEAWVELAAHLGVALTHRGYDVSYASTAGDADGSEPDAPAPGADTDASAAADPLVIVLGTEDQVAGAGWVAAEGSGPEHGVAVGTVDERPAVAVTRPDPDAIVPLLTTSALGFGSGTSVDPHVISAAGLDGERVSIEQLGTDTSVRDVRRLQGWAVDYAVADLPGGRAPMGLDLDLQLPAGRSDTIDTVHVELNGTIVASTRVDAPGTAHVVVPLPGELQLLRNRIDVTFQRERQDGGCLADDDPYPVQLLPSSSLTFGSTGATVGGFVAAPAAFSSGLEVQLPTTATGAGAVDALGRLVPVLAEVVGSHQPTTFRWVAPGERAPTPTTPFLALDQIPEGVELPVQVDGDRLVNTVDGATTIDVAGLTDVTVVSLAHRAAGPPLGIVVLSTGHGPALDAIRMGQEQALIVPRHGQVVEVLPSGALRMVDPPRADASPLS